jgi:archaellum component FlaC
MKFAKEKKMDELLKELKEQINKAEKELKKVTKENIKLKDEVGSLWDLLDELEESDVKNWTHLLDKIEKDAILKNLMTTTKKVDC